MDIQVSIMPLSGTEQCDSLHLNGTRVETFA
jgi:hypothetical protein